MRSDKAIPFVVVTNNVLGSRSFSQPQPQGVVCCQTPYLTAWGSTGLRSHAIGIACNTN